MAWIGVGVKVFARKQGQRFPLDALGINPAVAYSVRRLRKAYTGPALRVRRSSDNAEQDIGFAPNGWLDTAQLLSFVGSGNGFVTRWYDQMGIANLVQVTPSAQLRIVNSGVIEVSGGRPAAIRTGQHVGMRTTAGVVTPQQTMNYFYVGNILQTQTNLGSTYYIGLSAANLGASFFINGLISFVLINTNLSSHIGSGTAFDEVNAAVSTGPLATEAVVNSANQLIVRRNNNLIASKATTLTPVNQPLFVNIGLSNSNAMIAYQEAIICQNLNTAQSQALTSNQMQAFNI